MDILREKDFKKLDDHLRHRHSVEIIGMNRVGINNFLRHFLLHPKHTENRLYIPVDLLDMVEIDVYPFWVLTFKRIIDTLERSQIRSGTKKQLSALFLRSIQTHDLFMTIEGIRQCLTAIVDEGILPTIFYIRFDRIKNNISAEFFANLIGLVNATDNRLSYVFTSNRNIHTFAPEVISKNVLSLFIHRMYLKPAETKDRLFILQELEAKYNITVPAHIEREVVSLTAGHVQYLQLAVIILHELFENKLPFPDKVLALLTNDERVNMLSEEIWDSLAPDEQSVLQKTIHDKPVSEVDREKAIYLWNTGIIAGENDTLHIFNPLLERFIKSSLKNGKDKSQSPELTKKEHRLYSLLFSNINAVCERDMIIGKVWPEYEELGVSDWTIDRLMSRLRGKLIRQKSPYSIMTIRSRGFKMMSLQ